jgi:hypothetical protein
MLRPHYLEAPHTAKWLLAVLLALSVGLACFTHGTYDSGDSLQHYLFARYAFQHPLNFLDSWAKPLFTLLIAGPAQAGLVGVKLFQCAVVAGSAWCAYLIARDLRLPAAALAVLFTYAAPDYFRIQFSGLTEPLFGLVLVGAVALAFRNRLGWSAALISWLPFVRSEGFILLGIWVVYLVLKRQWHCLPLLGLGYLVFSAVGALALGEPGWVFGRNPYATVSVYGHGSWGHFISNIPGLLGWVLATLFALGGIRMLRDCAKPARRQEVWFWAELLLIYGSTTVFIAAHTVFWALGLFNSFGLTRVLTVITPLAAVVALNGLAMLSGLGSSERARQQIRIGAAVAVVAFLFTGLRSALRWQRDFGLVPEQQLAAQTVDWLKRTYGPDSLPPVAYLHPAVGAALGIDVFDKKLRPAMVLFPPQVPKRTSVISRLRPPAVVVWDDWFATTEGGIPRQRLQADPHFRQRWEVALPRDPSHPERDTCRFVVFERVQ